MVSSYTTFLRKICNQAAKIDGHPLFPGHVVSKNKSYGKTLPAGYISGAWADTPIRALKSLALHCLAGRTQALSSWEISF